MSKHIRINLPEEERNELEHLIRSGSSLARTQTWARILLLADRSQGQKRTDGEIAAALLCYKGTVGNVRRRHQDHGLQDHRLRVDFTF